MRLLKTPDGSRYSRKNITWALAIVLLLAIVIRGSWTGNWPPSYVFDGILALIVLVLTGTIIDKKIKNSTQPE